MVGVYLSGTGNTEHCIEKLVKMLDSSAECFPLEHTDIIQILNNHDTIIVGFFLLSNFTFSRQTSQ